MPTSRTPRNLGAYRVLRRLGGGAYSHCYLVASEEGEYAAKWIRRDPAEGFEVACLRLENERQALRALDHPNLPKYVDFGHQDGRPYLIETYVPGPTLRALHQGYVTKKGRLPELTVALLLEGTASALSHLHNNNIIHRDVKDDNIIVKVPVSEPVLVDLGVCKRTASTNENPTFWNAGASRFSPPSKLRHPSIAKDVHDTFALGVLGYLLLTNEYPWEVPEDRDVGHLLDTMLRKELKPIRALNNSVEPTLATAVERLLHLDDTRRPSAGSALDDLQAARTKLEAARVRQATTSHQIIGFPRVIRDPLHGDIHLTEFEREIINTWEIQRLRWLRQLGFSHYVYPGAEHSRFSHALGTMHIADQILLRIERRSGTPFDPAERLLARTLALIHDVTHIPYGHTLEDELGLFPRHDANRARLQRLILGEDSELHQVLSGTEYGREAMLHLDPDATVSKRSWVTELIGSPAGADVIDYVDRDALYCGLHHRIDSAIFRRYAISKSSIEPPDRRHLRTLLYGRDGFRLDAEFAVESVLVERFALFLKVYTHPAKIAAGAMLGKAVQELGFREARLEQMGDDQAIAAIAASRKWHVKELGCMLRRRRLYRPAFRVRIFSENAPTLAKYYEKQAYHRRSLHFDLHKRREMEATVAREAKVKPHEVVIYFPPKAPGLQRVSHYVETSPGQQERRDESHDRYDSILRKHLALWIAYAFVAPGVSAEKAARVGEATEDALGLVNDLKTGERRQLAMMF